MVSLEDGKKATIEIAEFLKTLTPEQKVRTRDFLEGITFMAAKQDKDQPDRKTG